MILWQHKNVPNLREKKNRNAKNRVKECKMSQKKEECLGEVFSEKDSIQHMAAWNGMMMKGKYKRDEELYYKTNQLLWFFVFSDARCKLNLCVNQLILCH